MGHCLVCPTGERPLIRTARDSTFGRDAADAAPGHSLRRPPGFSSPKFPPISPQPVSREDPSTRQPVPVRSWIGPQNDPDVSCETEGIDQSVAVPKLKVTAISHLPPWPSGQRAAQRLITRDPQSPGRSGSLASEGASKSPGST